MPAPGWVAAAARPDRVAGALVRYRVLAFITGVLINILYFVGIPLQLAGHPGVVHLVGFLHGMAFIGYVLTILDLGYRCRWPVLRILLVMAAGLLPVMTFVAERRVTRGVQDALAGAGGGPGAGRDTGAPPVDRGPGAVPPADVV
jgi:integral membrane protein